MQYYVSKTGKDTNDGSKAAPFQTIGAAAYVARAGDTVTVHEGEYREWVKPEEGGLSNVRRIVYQAAENERVVIKGSERINNWEQVEGTVWKALIPNVLFDGYNPFDTVVRGDWMIFPEDRLVHLGDVYLNGNSFYEAVDYEHVKNPEVKKDILDNWTEEIIPVHNVEQTKYCWFASVEAEETILYANFHGADPNQELVEINVRQSCFYPTKTGVSYITVRGFEMAQAATPWAPPTGNQPGLVGPNWSKGWIIENNIIHDAKCSAITIGKEASTGDNYRTYRRDKPGYQYQLESVFAARKIGWSKETIGSHIIRNNTIYDCGQNGIVGHLGCVFSEICNNHIYNIALKREFYGHEIAGIKLHAAIDVHIHHNQIHDCSLGTWLDWEAQGVRVSKNLYYKNNRDLFIEVTHGPHMVDHNILGSKYSLDNHAQGGAYINNIFAGKIMLRKILDRATPYHAPHSTDVTGFAIVYGGDDRFYQNVFIGGQTQDGVGTYMFDPNMTSLEEYMTEVDKLFPGDHEIFNQVEQPVYIDDNMYLEGARAFAKEKNAIVKSDFKTEFAIEQAADGVYLCVTLPDDYTANKFMPLTTATLPRVRIVDADFEDFDGGCKTFDSDYFNVIQEDQAIIGPCATLKSGKNRIKVWSI